MVRAAAFPRAAPHDRPTPVSFSRIFLPSVFRIWSSWEIENDRSEFPDTVTPIVPVRVFSRSLCVNFIVYGIW